VIQKKICMLGAFAVGKTSLVRRFVTSMFSEKYHTTVGVKIDRKTVAVGGQEVNLVVWDIYGEDAFQQVNLSYLRGSAGYLLVVDGTRSATLATARSLQQRVEEAVGRVPFVMLLNKSDLEREWDLDADAVAKFSSCGWSIVTVSAKTGRGVEDAFAMLAERVIGV
jgi:small GTP-binding protein